MAKPRIGVGTTISQWLHKGGIRKLKGCGCKKLEADLDRNTTVYIRKNLDHYTDRMVASSKKWRNEVKPTSMTEALVRWVPPNRLAIKSLILKACDVVDDRLKTTMSRPEQISLERKAKKGDLLTVCVTYYMRAPDLRNFVASVPPELPILIDETGGNLSAGRNRLMQRCETPYALICEEDFEFSRETDVQQLLDVVQHDPQVVFAAGRVLDGRNQWHHNFHLEKQLEGWPKMRAYLSREDWQSTDRGTLYQTCDLVKNFGVVDVAYARKHKWDEILELSEHHDWFLTMEDTPYRAAYVPSVGIVHHMSRPTEEYILERKRAWPLHRKMQQLREMFIEEPEVEKTTNVVVLGVAHSNTSLLAGQLDFLGFNAPGPLQPGKAENLEVVELNEQVLKGEPFDFDRAREVLSKFKSPWLIKDPRFAQTIQHWLGAFAPHEPLLVLIEKDQFEVKRSWLRRGRPAHAVEPLQARCRQIYDLWPWAKVKVKAEHLVEASSFCEKNHGEAVPADG